MAKFSTLGTIIFICLFGIWIIFPETFFFKTVFTGIDVGRRHYLDLVSLISIVFWYWLWRKLMKKPGLQDAGDNGRKIIDGDSFAFALVISTLLTVIWNFVL